MSEPVEKQDDGAHVPSPFFPKAAALTDENGIYKPVDPFDKALRVTVVTGLLLGGMHLRRLVQLRKGSQRPGTAKYIGMFQTSKRQLIGLPLAAGTFSFLHDCLQNIAEDETGLNELISSGVASFVGLIASGSTPVTKSLGISVGVGVLFGAARWAGGFDGLRENSHYNTKQAGKIRPVEETSADVRDDRQGFWEGVYRRPLSQTVEDLGEGRGILKP